ncbi:serine protease 1-like [Bactrocera neohumeralis]|uniref:serine protease 1-like n=1 Tax=Bactrocera neohumeralis TaxID=98809 RepID=UPI0021659DDF|nr:serine protease 1-like [Bactrocera neohumeralis]
MKSIICLALTLAVASAFDPRAEEIFEHARYVPVVSEEIDGRITNGKNASTNQFPYQVGLLLKTDNGTKWCGGSLIGQNWVLSAAHCIETVTSVKVCLGATVRTSPTIIYNVSRSDIIVHPSWDKKTTQNDISLIRIPSVNYTAAIQPVALPKIASSYPTYDGESVIASGWGRTSDTSNSPASILQYANMTVISNAVCKESYNGISANNICTATTGGISTCNGDSGGPLVLASSKIQVGLTSFISGAGCSLGYPAAFTRLTSYLEWILQETGISA